MKYWASRVFSALRAMLLRALKAVAPEGMMAKPDFPGCSAMIG